MFPDIDSQPIEPFYYKTQQLFGNTRNVAYLCDHNGFQIAPSVVKRN